MALGRMFKRDDYSEERALSYQQVWGSGGDWNPSTTWSGASVSYDTALQVSTVYACVRLISDTISTFPAAPFYRKNGERLPFNPKPAWIEQPDIGITRADHVQQIVFSMLLTHGACVRIYRNGDGEIVALIPLDPMRVEPQYNNQGQMEFLWDHQKVIPARDIMYIPMMRRPGSAKGISPLDEVKQTLGLASALDEFASRFFSGGSNVGGVIETPALLSKEQAQQAKEAFEASHKGRKKSHSVAVLGGGAKFVKATVDPERAQALESRRFSVEQIASIFRVPLHMLQVAAPGVQSFASNEENAIEFSVYTLRPIVSKIEDAYTALLPGGAFLKFNMDAILRGDLSARFAAYSTGIQGGFLNLNQINRLEDWPAVDGGDVYRVPLANVALAAADLTETDMRVKMATTLIDSGADPAETLAAFNLPPITFAPPTDPAPAPVMPDPMNPAP